MYILSSTWLGATSVEIQLLVQNEFVEFKKQVVRVQCFRLMLVILEEYINYNHNFKDEPKDIDM